MLSSTETKIYPAHNVNIYERININMPIIVGILTFMSKINTGFGDLNLKFQFIWVTLSFMSILC